jgi:hypothetical protein
LPEKKSSRKYFKNIAQICCVLNLIAHRMQSPSALGVLRAQKVFGSAPFARNAEQGLVKLIL